jgi:aspartyl-tRNA synthetase
MKPIWLVIGPGIEEYLGEKFNWRTLSVIAEERVNPRDNPAWKDNEVARKIRHAEKEGIRHIDMPHNEPLPEALKERIDARIKDWQEGRKGKQVHITEIRPWIDQEHRWYFYAAQGNKDGRIHAFIVLHQLSPENGYQVKFSLEFPGAPSGTIESLTLHALSAIASRDPATKSVTFGTGATEDIAGGRNIGKHRMAALKKTYEAINKSLKLTNKSEYRAKLGARDERVFVAYPKGGLGMMGIKAILGFIGAEGEHGPD